MIFVVIIYNRRIFFFGFMENEKDFIIRTLRSLVDEIFI